MKIGDLVKIIRNAKLAVVTRVGEPRPFNAALQNIESEGYIPVVDARGAAVVPWYEILLANGNRGECWHGDLELVSESR